MMNDSVRLINAITLKHRRGIAGDAILHEIIDNEPTVEAMPLKHAHWIKFGGRGSEYSDRWQCSNCERTARSETWSKTCGYALCPHCGAWMSEDMKTDGKIIAVDFDGTLCESAWPQIGAPRMEWINYVKGQQLSGAKLILWTNRCGEQLEEAVEWCKAQGIVFDAVNDNLPEMIELYGNNCRKVFAHEYLDDKAKPATNGGVDSA